MKTIFAAAAVSVIAMAGAANAATLSFVGGTGNSAGTVLNGGDGNVAQNVFASHTGGSIGFSWADTSPNYLAYSEFTIDSDFRLIFDDYEPAADIEGGVGAKSGFQLYAGSFGSVSEGLIGSDQCGADVLAAFGDTDCTFVTGDRNDPALFTVPPETYGVFGAGTYVLMFSEGNQPFNGGAEFVINAVPVPASALLLLAGLGGLGAMKRRKKA